MNIVVQSCGLFMLIVLLVISLREKSLDISRRQKFLNTIFSCVACLVMDILSIITIVYANAGQIHDMVAFVVCKLYLILLINVGYRGFLYTADEFFEGNAHRTLRNIYRIVFLVGIVAIAVLPINYYCYGRIVYSEGPSAIATYCIAFVLLISTMIMALASGKRTSRRRKRVIIVWQAGWIVASLVQFLKPDFLVVSFAAAFGIVLVYAELENPNEGIDRVSGQFTSNALYSYVMDLYRRNDRFSAMHISIDYSAGDFDLELETKAMKRVAYFLDNHRSYVFRESDHDFVVIYKDKEKMQSDYERTASGLEAFVDLPIKTAYTLMPDNRVLKNADEFMQFLHYKDKDADFSNCTVAGSDMAEDMRSYLKIRDQISKALANNRVEVYYQPIYDVKEDRFTTAEALVRIRDEEGNFVMPGRFISIAEENGLIIPLGIEVFRQVCEFLATGRAQKLGIKYIEINLSMAQFNENEPATFIQDTMSRYGIDPGLINLEITETADPTARRVILDNMRVLMDKGVHFSLDDFGTGRSNFDYLVEMPVDIIKFDYKFTHWYFESEKARDVMKSIVGIIEGMDLPIVMEGIETREELDIMIGLGASYIQGYYFSEPLSGDELLKFLQENMHGNK